jgi:hypothetical protein
MRKIDVKLNVTAVDNQKYKYGGPRPSKEVNRVKCPYLGRKVSSYRFAGFVCNAQAVPTTMGFISEWTKEQRASYMEKNGCEHGGDTCWLLNRLKEKSR